MKIHTTSSLKDYIHIAEVFFNWLAKLYKLKDMIFSVARVGAVE